MGTKITICRERDLIAPANLLTGDVDPDGDDLTILSFVVAGAVIVGLATLASASLVFLLSLRLRRREIETMVKIGGSRPRVAAVLVSEVVVVLMLGAALS